LLPVQAGAPLINALKKKQVDAIGYWDTIYDTVKSQGFNLTRVMPAKGQEPAFTTCYVARNDWLEKNPKAAAALSRAQAKAYLFAATNPEAAAKVTLKVHPTLRPTSQSEQEAIASGVAQIASRLSNIKIVDDKLGYVTQDQVANAVDLAFEGGVIKERVAPDTVFTDKFIDDANSFDRAKVIEFAKTYQG